MAVGSTFRSLLVTEEDMSIQVLVTKSKLTFKSEKIFYQLKGPRAIQPWEEIVARRKSDELFLTGSALKVFLGLDEEDLRYNLEENHFDDFDLFVQCLFDDHVLEKGTEVLIEDDKSSYNVSPFNANLPSSDHVLFPSNVPVLSPGKPGSPLEIVLCFDTTGSMGECIVEFSKHAKQVFERILTDISDIRICVFAHGDYIDRIKYVTTYTDFTRDGDLLSEWVGGVETTYGGDWEECYELVLHEVRTKLSWSGSTRRVLVMIGDSIPHTQKDSEMGLDWQEELASLVDQLGVMIYAIQCYDNVLAGEFWGTLAQKSGGHHLHLDSFSRVQTFVEAICYHQMGPSNLKAYQEEVQGQFEGQPMPSALSDLFDALTTEPLPQPPIIPPSTMATSPWDCNSLGTVRLTSLMFPAPECSEAAVSMATTGDGSASPTIAQNDATEMTEVKWEEERMTDCEAGYRGTPCPPVDLSGSCIKRKVLKTVKEVVSKKPRITPSGDAQQGCVKRPRGRPPKNKRFKEGLSNGHSLHFGNVQKPVATPMEKSLNTTSSQCVLITPRGKIPQTTIKTVILSKPTRKPSKINSNELTFAKPRGRPPKTGANGQTLAKPRSRPLKTVANGQTLAKPRGRPPKTGANGQTLVKPRGRPPKAGANGQALAKPRGRPPKTGANGQTLAKQKGRPPKTDTNGQTLAKPKGRTPKTRANGQTLAKPKGRTPKSDTNGQTLSKPRGRPPNTGANGQTLAKPKGRPSKTDTNGQTLVKPKGRPSKIDTIRKKLAKPRNRPPTSFTNIKSLPTQKGKVLKACAEKQTSSRKLMTKSFGEAGNT